MHATFSQLRPLLVALLLSLGIAALFPDPASAASTHELLASFSAPPQHPSSGTLAPGGDGYYWGTTPDGGAYGFGTIYKVKADGSDWQVVLSFRGGGPINAGSYPFAGLVSDGAGSFWGTTYFGGASSFGTVFKVNTTTGILTTLVEFSGNGPNNKGSYPFAALASDGTGSFWGTTTFGGANNSGTVFKINANTGVLTTLIEFSGNGVSNKGRSPYAALLNDGLGFFWGTTEQGGANNLGTLFKIDSNTTALTTLVQFSGNGASNKGSFPYAPLVSDGLGSIWGTTTSGGANSSGTLFKVNASAGTLATLIEFTGNGASNKGSSPKAALLNDGLGFFWGSTEQGGTSNFGTLFKINATTGVLTTIVQFDDGLLNRGRYPKAALFNDGLGSFWGTTEQGGGSGYGTVFKLNASTGALTTVVGAFGASYKGRYPTAGLLDDGAGSYWGTTSAGGANDYGTIFKIAADTEVFTTVVAFTGAAGSYPGASPFAVLVSDGAGSFWGTTRQGGAGDYGTIFKVNTITGALTTIVEFTGNGLSNKGASPFAALVNDGAGSFWGTTPNGGANDYGTVFKVNMSTGVLTTLVEFQGNGAGNKGFYPFAGLVSDGAGFFWGTTFGFSGALPPNYGTVFKVNATTGILSTLVEFTGNGPSNKGSAPFAGLVSDGAGVFYGTTFSGGANDLGTVFKVNATTGTLATLVEFTGNGASNRGSNPEAGLVRNGPNSFLGTTQQGGASNFGTVFKVNSSTGTLTTLVELTGTGMQTGSGANLAYGSLLKPSDGNIYGTTVGGGPTGGGTVFRVRQPNPVTLPASTVTVTSAILNASVNPNNDGAATSSFLFGTNPSLAGAGTISSGVVANGGSAIPVSVTASGLAPSTTYYFSALASNAGNPVPQQGAIASFTTPADTTAPQISNIPANITVTATSPSGAVVTYTMPTASDDVEVTSFTASTASGATFPIGLTTVTFTAQDAASNSAMASFTVRVLTALEAWRQAYFGITTDTGNAADTFDFDHDGVVNLVEYAFGLNPTLRSSNQLPPAEPIGSNFVTSFTQPTGVTGVTYKAEWSATLEPLDWHAIADTGILPQHTFSVPIGTNRRLYMRLKVTNP